MSSDALCSDPNFSENKLASILASKVSGILSLFSKVPHGHWV